MKKKKLSKRQLDVLADLFDGQLTERQILDKYKVGRNLFSRWLSDEAFAGRKVLFVSPPVTAVSTGEMEAAVGFVKQVKRAVAAAHQRHQFGEQASAKFVRLLGALQIIRDVGDAHFHPALAFGILHREVIILQGASQLPNLRTILLEHGD